MNAEKQDNNSIQRNDYERVKSDKEPELGTSKSWSMLILIWAYIIGSVLFVGGCILFHPYFSYDILFYKLSVAMFIVGSSLFLFGAVYEWQTSYHQLLKYNPYVLLEDQIQKKGLSPTFLLENHAVDLTRSTVNLINGVLFVTGSAAFWPSFGDGGVLLGNWCFRISCSFLFIIMVWSIYRSFKPTNQSRREVILLQSLYVQYLLGAGGFIAGGALFEAGDVAMGAIVWGVGSIFFTTGSLVMLIM